jgi:(2Fe-2S) ferredoxin
VYRCSFAAESRGDPQFATAAPAAGFLIVEYPGAWGRRALTDSRLSPTVAAELGARALAASLRVLLVKRHGRRVRGETHRWAVVDARAGHEGIMWGSYRADDDLVEVPLHIDEVEPSREPCYLVCTHGVHDACCALRGRPVVAEFARLREESTWECSHVGGDRFAPNVVVLPHGLYYGRVSVDDVETIIDAQQRNEVVPALLRGRSTFTPAIQAAQHFARLQLNTTAIGALSPLDDVAEPDGTHTVRMRTATGTVTVTVRPTLGDGAGLLTCRATVPLHPPTFALETIAVENLGAE